MKTPAFKIIKALLAVCLFSLGLARAASVVDPVAVGSGLISEESVRVGGTLPCEFGH